MRVWCLGPLHVLAPICEEARRNSQCAASGLARDTMLKTVLLIEDDAMHRKLFSAWLETGGYRISTLADERLAYLEAINQRPDLIIADIRLPYLDGRDVIRRLKTSVLTRHIPIMALSVLSGWQEEESCKSAGAEIFLNKTIRMATFINHVAELIGRPHRCGERITPN